eukprot:m.230259 g.230259  ORF g.230259 m.230259 type:complete len:922 (+) comp13891_c0_seq7:218-2983(+)
MNSNHYADGVGTNQAVVFQGGSNRKKDSEDGTRNSVFKRLDEGENGDEVRKEEVNLVEKVQHHSMKNKGTSKEHLDDSGVNTSPTRKTFTEKKPRDLQVYTFAPHSKKPHVTNEDQQHLDNSSNDVLAAIRQKLQQEQLRRRQSVTRRDSGAFSGSNSLMDVHIPSPATQHNEIPSQHSHEHQPQLLSREGTPQSQHSIHSQNQGTRSHSIVMGTKISSSSSSVRKAKRRLPPKNQSNDPKRFQTIAMSKGAQQRKKRRGSMSPAPPNVRTATNSMVTPPLPSNTPPLTPRSWTRTMYNPHRDNMVSPRSYMSASSTRSGTPTNTTFGQMETAHQFRFDSRISPLPPMIISTKDGFQPMTPSPHHPATSASHHHQIPLHSTDSQESFCEEMFLMPHSSSSQDVTDAMENASLNSPSLMADEVNFTTPVNTSFSSSSSSSMKGRTNVPSNNAGRGLSPIGVKSVHRHLRTVDDILNNHNVAFSAPQTVGDDEDNLEEDEDMDVAGDEVPENEDNLERVDKTLAYKQEVNTLRNPYPSFTRFKRYQSESALDCAPVHNRRMFGNKGLFTEQTEPSQTTEMEEKKIRPNSKTKKSSQRHPRHRRPSIGSLLLNGSNSIDGGDNEDEEEEEHVLKPRASFGRQKSAPVYLNEKHGFHFDNRFALTRNEEIEFNFQCHEGGDDDNDDDSDDAGDDGDQDQHENPTIPINVQEWEKSRPVLLHSTPDSGNTIEHCITPDELYALLTNTHENSHKIKKKIVIDCRYFYEFALGHIKGAINLSSAQALCNHFFLPLENRTCNRDVVIVFHCEFSSKRGPSQFKIMRTIDRIINEFSGSVIFPEMYVLKGGIKAFNHKYGQDDSVFEGKYVEMTNKEVFHLFPPAKKEVELLNRRFNEIQSAYTRKLTHALKSNTSHKTLRLSESSSGFL